MLFLNLGRDDVPCGLWVFILHGTWHEKRMLEKKVAAGGKQGGVKICVGIFMNNNDCFRQNYAI